LTFGRRPYCDAAFVLQPNVTAPKSQLHSYHRPPALPPARSSRENQTSSFTDARSARETKRLRSGESQCTRVPEVLRRFTTIANHQARSATFAVRRKLSLVAFVV